MTALFREISLLRSELNNEISQKRAVISSFAKVENKFRTFQKQIEIFTKISSLAQQSEYINLITSLTPREIVLNSVSDNDGSIQITGTSSNQQNISQFIKNLSSNDKLKDVSLSRVDSSEDNPSAIVFTIKASISGI